MIKIFVDNCALIMNLDYILTISDISQHLNLIEDVENGGLRSPSSLPEPSSIERILIKLISGIHQKSKSAPMVLHATIEKLMTFSAPLSSEMRFLTEGCGSVNKRYGFPPGKRGVNKNTKSSHPDGTHTAESISPQPTTSSVLPGYATGTLSPLTMGRQHCPHYGVPLAVYIPVSTHPLHVPPYVLSSHDYHSYGMITQSTQPDTSHSGHKSNMCIIRTILPRPHHRMGPHSAFQSGIDSS